MNIEFHSRVSMITNSSTSLFIIHKPIENLEDLLQGMIDLHNRINGSNISYEGVFKPLRVYEQSDFQADIDGIAEANKRWPDARFPYEGWGYEVQKNVGATFLEGAEDNSIPGWMKELIEQIGGERWHLG